MPYPIKTQGTVLPGRTLTVPFRPAAAGLVNAIVTVDGSLPFLHPPASVALRLDVFKPGAATPAISKTGSHTLTSPQSTFRLVLWGDTAAAAADLNADWTIHLVNTGGVSASCNLTVRYQVVSGNLGKIDHIVVVMMENRSFDHMLGYLRHEGNRTDIDGLTGTESNRDANGNLFPVNALTRTYFRNDPGHGWNEVAEQLAADTGHPSNGGFVRNFVKHLAGDAAALPPVLGNVADTAQVADGGTRSISFRPGQPGPIVIFSSATPHPTRAESGKLGKATLLRPGGGTPVAIHVSSLAETAVGLTYQATAADLAIPGNWTCDIVNSTDTTLSFKTNITFVQSLHDTSLEESPGSIMGYHNAAQLPVYDQLAKNFTVCDQWYASLPTDTWPNRLYSLTGGSGGLVNTPSDAQTAVDPPGFTLKTIFEVLQERGLDWRIFFSDLPFALVFKRLAQDATYTARMRPISDFLQRAATGDLPDVAWIDPNFNDVPDGVDRSNDDHPPGDVSHGQWFLSQIYGALCRSPAWSKTLLLITYDEHGGFFDHVLPPGTTLAGQPPAPGAPQDDDPNLRMYGVRVPAFVVSPWVVPKSVSKTVYDHTSLLSTILKRFCAGSTGAPPSMGARADHANDVGPLLSNASPTPVEVPPALTLTNSPTPTRDPNAFGSVLRKFVMGL